jgi:hypothetical protein
MALEHRALGSTLLDALLLDIAVDPLFVARG